MMLACPCGEVTENYAAHVATCPRIVPPMDFRYPGLVSVANAQELDGFSVDTKFLPAHITAQRVVISALWVRVEHLVIIRAPGVGRALKAQALLRARRGGADELAACVQEELAKDVPSWDTALRNFVRD